MIDSLMKKISFYWSLLVGVLVVALQIIVFYLRFGHWNTDSSMLDYLLFFVAGTLAGLLLLYFMNHQAVVGRRWILLGAFLLASPLALIMMVGGGLLGPLGVILIPLIPWAAFLLLGAWLGSFMLRD